jgi:hypothetical protein
MNVQIITATIENPIRGVWVADLVSVDEPQSGEIQILNTTFTGTVLSKRLDGGVWKSRFIGGNYALHKSPGFRQYRGNVNVSTIVSDVIRFCGENPGTINVNRYVDSFERSDQSAAMSLNILADLFDCVWYIGFDGKTHFVPSRDGRAIQDPIVLETTGDEATMYVDDFADVQPGDLIEGKRVEHARYLLSPNSSIAEIRFRAPLDKPDRAWYARTYRAQVDKQNADYSVDVVVDSRFQLSRVPLYAPAKTILDSGDLVTIGFFRADPRLPFAVPCQTSKEIDCGGLVYIPGTPGSLTYTPPATKENPIPTPVTVSASPATPTKIIGVIK